MLYATASDDATLERRAKEMQTSETNTSLTEPIAQAALSKCKSDPATND